MGRFHIDATNLSWLEGIPEPEADLCLHGHAVAVIEDRTLEYDCTVSATALYLLKTLTEDHILNEDNQMLPCCGHFLIPNDVRTEVTIAGCCNGIDWTVRHGDGFVRLILEDGYTVSVAPEDYRREVLAFVQKIEDFYNADVPRVLPEDEWDRDAYLTFWREWHRRKGNAQ